MKKFFVNVGTLFLIIAAFLIGKFSQNNVGRYQIYMNPIVRADQILLDTKTARTWQFSEEEKDKYMFWHELPRDALPEHTESD